VISGTFSKHRTRTVHCLDAIWDFVFLGDVGVPQPLFDWPKPDRLPVPSAFDAFPSYVGKRGVGLYRRMVQVNPGTSGRIFFGAVSIWCRVYVDGVQLAEHGDGYSGFWVEVPESAATRRELTVLVDNRFDRVRSPLHEPYFDFYQYGGILRTVEWHEVSAQHVQSVRVSSVEGVEGQVRISAELAGHNGSTATVGVGFDGRPESAHQVAVVKGHVELLANVPDAHQWNVHDPFLHVLRLTYEADDMCVRFGLRTVATEGGHILINGEPVKLLGYCRHESHPQFGPALPLAQLVADLQLLRDLGCNFIRGTHYPQDQRFLDLCDELGFLVWEETLGWQQDSRHFTDPAYARAHREAVDAMVSLSVNHPCIIMWGFLNEGESSNPASRSLYENTVAQLRSLDPTRLVSYASHLPTVDLNFDLVDVIGVNTYPGWYGDLDDTDPLELIRPAIEAILRSLAERGLAKPILLSEIGAEALPGWHDPHDGFWTEEYQAQYLRIVCDMVVGDDRLAGVALWQFHDIRTYQGMRAVKRPRAFNNKGTLDEYRRPKRAYRVVRDAFGNGHTEGRS
jgi:beta-glucuronidase